jgi:hypothetical protein
MRYMLLIYTREEEALRASEEAMQKEIAGHRAAMDDARKRGVFESAEPLAPTTTATTVRVRDGKALTTDGPFAETKEQLAGYYILDCKDLDEAIEWAARLPTACGGADGCVEIRPFRGLSAPDHNQPSVG